MCHGKMSVQRKLLAMKLLISLAQALNSLHQEVWPSFLRLCRYSLSHVNKSLVDALMATQPRPTYGTLPRYSLIKGLTIAFSQLKSAKRCRQVTRWIQWPQRRCQGRRRLSLASCMHTPRTWRSFQQNIGIYGMPYMGFSERFMGFTLDLYMGWK